MQKLTATRAELIHDKEKELWMVTGDAKPLSAAYVAAAREILHLCLLSTALARPGRTHYVLTREGRRVLIDPGYTPAYLQTRIRPS
jgi:hypothetical protein